MSDRDSLSKRYPRATPLFLGWLVLTAGLFGAGVFLPFMTLSQLMFFNHSISIFSGLMELISNGEYGLFALIVLFTMVTPLVKIVAMGLVWFWPLVRRERYLLWMERYGKWSMLDVFVVALMVVMVKLDGLATVEVHVGAYVFAASVLMMMALSAWMMAKLQRA